jgi:phenylacetyl-CoA:acceptor oxidoreductase
MKRTNPKKGRDEDPGFVPISWDEALDTIAERLKATRAKGVIDESGVPRLAASFGHGGTPAMYMGTFPAFLAAWGPIDFSFGSGQGVKCVHSEHLYGEFWHRAFTVAADTPSASRYVISLGANVESSGGPCAVTRHADARDARLQARAGRAAPVGHRRLLGRVGADPAEDRPAFMFALIHVMLIEHKQDELDVPFLRDRTSSPYLVVPTASTCAIPHAQAAGLGSGAEQGRALRYPRRRSRARRASRQRVRSASMPDECGPPWAVEGVTAAFQAGRAHRKYSPEWAQGICDVPAATIRRIANEYLENASVGATTVIDGVTLPLRPVAVILGKSVNNGWGAYECCWARTVLAVLVGALECPAARSAPRCA